MGGRAVVYPARYWRQCDPGKPSPCPPAKGFGDRAGAKLHTGQRANRTLGRVCDRTQGALNHPTVTDTRRADQPALCISKGQRRIPRNSLQSVHRDVFDVPPDSTGCNRMCVWDSFVCRHRCPEGVSKRAGRREDSGRPCAFRSEKLNGALRAGGPDRCVNARALHARHDVGGRACRPD